MSERKKPWLSTGNKEIDLQLKDLVTNARISCDPEFFQEILVTVMKFAQDNPNPADIRLVNKALKELCRVNTIFQPYKGIKKVAVFGSARTEPEAPEYIAAKDFGKIMKESGFMIITGGGDGIMGAAQAGAGRDRGFALNIQLPFEQSANATIEGDPKLFTFKYFFTRKLHFVKNADAITLFPGGFGTMDEGFEAMTLMQTGKAPVLPVVMVDAPKGKYWKTFENYLREHLLRAGLISEQDFNLFKVTDDPEEARKEILNFYYNFHSYRDVNELLSIRMQRPITEGALKRIEDDFNDIIVEGGRMKISKALPEELNEVAIADLPRLVFPFDRRSYGRLRMLIDRINLF
ncbi:MAG: TIGR00730 family Rossman fold protein [Verrucomicrobiota bacterium]